MTEEEAALFERHGDEWQAIDVEVRDALGADWFVDKPGPIFSTATFNEFDDLASVRYGVVTFFRHPVFGLVAAAESPIGWRYALVDGPVLDWILIPEGPGDLN